MESSDLYQILGIPEYSEVEIVKRMFRKLALKYHPDRNPDPEAVEIFKGIVKAYEVLGDPVSKETYDRKKRSGINFEYPGTATNAESIRAEQRVRYARMRREQNEMREVENITAYENSLKVFPYLWRIIIIGMLNITGIMSVLIDWYQKGYKIAMGIFIFVFSSIFLWNELYKHFWHKSRIRDEDKYDRRAYSIFLVVFFTGIISIIGLIKIKKIWHLHYFGKIIYATIDTTRSTITYTYDNKYFMTDVYEIPGNVYLNSMVLIKISTREPEIWEYAGD